jgi:hypothetical protein
LSLVPIPEELVLLAVPDEFPLLSVPPEVGEEPPLLPVLAELDDETPPVVDTEIFEVVAAFVAWLVATPAILVAVAVDVLVG